MKYGRIVYYHPGKPKGYINIGDYFQTFAIDLIYDSLGIKGEDIIDIDRHSLFDYAGEELILPINAWFGYKNDTRTISPAIHPIFLGYHCISKFSEDLSKFAPIGCRDEATYERLSRRGISASIMGCMTVLFPTREHTPVEGKIFIVDVPQKLMECIPNEIRNNAEYISHEISIKREDGSERSQKEIEEMAHHIIERYRNEATLVITSRLHCAMLCLASGINVIVLRDSIDDRFTFVDKFVPIYTMEDIPNINWEGHTVDLNYIKEKTMQCAQSIITGTECSELREELHHFYLDRTRTKKKRRFIVTIYEILHGVMPLTADFIREKILFKYTIAYNRRKE